nr:winged helix-turn-helix transcriptional regulator [Bacillus cereus]
MVDHIDIKILNLLKENSRVQWRDIGKEIHMTGQAVGNRIRKLEEEGIIRAYTILLDEMKLGKSHLAFIGFPQEDSFLNHVQGVAQ